MPQIRKSGEILVLSRFNKGGACRNLHQQSKMQNHEKDKHSIRITGMDDRQRFMGSDIPKPDYGI